jgi:hypothetical protein
LRQKTEQQIYFTCCTGEETLTQDKETLLKEGSGTMGCREMDVPMLMPMSV